MWLGLIALAISLGVTIYGIVLYATGRTARFEVIALSGAALIGTLIVVALVGNEGVGFKACDGQRLYLRRVCTAFLKSLPPVPLPPKQAGAGRSPPG